MSKLCVASAPPGTGSASPNCHSYVSAPVAPVTTAVNVRASPTTEGVRSVTSTSRAAEGRAQSASASANPARPRLRRARPAQTVPEEFARLLDTLSWS